jgi:hypothetical protein
MLKRVFAIPLGMRVIRAAQAGEMHMPKDGHKRTLEMNSLVALRTDWRKPHVRTLSPFPPQ